MIEITPEQSDEIVAKTLLETYNYVKEDAAQLIAKSNDRELQAFEKEDLESFESVLPALKKVLSWYMTHIDFLDKFGEDAEW
jgi:hypothetical protein